MMRKLEAYFGMRVVTYCVMSNHYHILVEEPDSDSVASLDADEILRRIKLLKDAAALKTVFGVRQEWHGFKQLCDNVLGVGVRQNHSWAP
jgi:REP element-mobilizing transposase RayT